jgi:hypothetical protein
MTSEALRSRSSKRFEIDEDASAVERGVDAIDADERGEALHRRVFEDDVGQRLLFGGHGGKEMFWAACEMPWMTPVSCTGKNPLGTMI